MTTSATAPPACSRRSTPPTARSSSSLHRRHRAIEFRKFLAKTDAEVPGHLEVHLGCDNYGTTYTSWINQVERFSGSVTTDLFQRSDHGSVQALETDIRAWITVGRGRDQLARRKA
jgi:hypothetical protein